MILVLVISETILYACDGERMERMCVKLHVNVVHYKLYVSEECRINHYEIIYVLSC